MPFATHTQGIVISGPKPDLPWAPLRGQTRAIGLGVGLNDCLSNHPWIPTATYSMDGIFDLKSQVMSTCWLLESAALALSTFIDVATFEYFRVEERQQDTRSRRVFGSGKLQHRHAVVKKSCSKVLPKTGVSVAQSECVERDEIHAGLPSACVNHCLLRVRFRESMSGPGACKPGQRTRSGAFGLEGASGHRNRLDPVQKDKTSWGHQPQHVVIFEDHVIGHRSK